MDYQRIASIVGLIQIYVASLESSWLSMLHGHVPCISLEHVEVTFRRLNARRS